MNFAALLGCTAVGLRPTSVAPQKRIKPTTEPRQESTYPKAKAVQTNGATSPDGKLDRFDIDSFRKDCLLKGVDEVTLTLGYEADIATFEARQHQEMSWLDDQH